ncbi:AglZ/HisF2 family acetamidino modification protein [Thalassospira indica]|uniref:Imidazole glycerol phosphate synthase subunit HisF n=1 Tax=Thalassospira indica TaxID=1891279 RepID=A0ABN5NB13_9PROT|nr:AglZ/HisF2 family acetamidino modification protein [Thalassospira indica]AXO13637.1 imidazole glycerol phosphate synthase subunit HisF [Thalassospira indica]OAZ14480.1 imidazole glycerol phosphate synthase [Thalassospira profundimaris]
MLRPRIIPCLLIRKGGLVKTVRFGESKYVGDPLNAVRIFNEKQVDELMVIDIDATVTGKEPNEKMISDLAAECRMPLCYGGGVKTVDQVERLVTLGVEKIAIGSAAIENPDLIVQAAARVGSQSIVGVVDVKATGLLRRYEVVIRNGRKRTGFEPAAYAQRLENLGVGEIFLNSVDCDGEMKGYDFNLIDRIKKAVKLPVTVLGGAGSINDIKDLVQRYPVIGAAAGSLFVFKGKYKAVLINYPSLDEKEALLPSDQL